VLYVGALFQLYEVIWRIRSIQCG